VIRVIRVPGCSHNNAARLPESRMTFRLLTLMLFAGTAAADPVPFVWIEAESPSESSPKLAPAGAGHPEWLSGGKWLFLIVEPKDQAAQLPKGEATFKYTFTLPADGNYEVWHRVGMEYVRSPFEWRIDDGGFGRVEPKEPVFQTIDLMELSTWTEIG